MTEDESGTAFVYVTYALVGSIGFEPTTPTMSRWCSNQLSYEPLEARIIETPGASHKPYTASMFTDECPSVRSVVRAWFVVPLASVCRRPLGLRVQRKNRPLHVLELEQPVIRTRHTTAIALHQARRDRHQHRSAVHA